MQINISTLWLCLLIESVFSTSAQMKAVPDCRDRSLPRVSQPVNSGLKN